MKWYMLTGQWPKLLIKRNLSKFVIAFDVKKWAYCIETGNTGYDHAHIKIMCSENMRLEVLQKYFPRFHVELSNENIEYLRKGDIFVSSEDTTEIRKVRFGEPLIWQSQLIASLNSQSVRQVTVLLDDEGGVGKSWLTNYLYEKQLGFWCPPCLSTPKDIIQFVASGYNFQPYIVIDIPRSWKWTEHLYTCIEIIKDGLVFDTRYSAKMRNIRGTKVLVFTNTRPKLSKLSIDRWVILDAKELSPRNTNPKVPIL